MDQESYEAPDGDIEGAELQEAAFVSCPYCAAPVELLIDAGGGGEQAYVEDCEVCCQPWNVHLRVDGQGFVTVTVTTLDGD